jgi:4'-phosphopantetheinyl transferase
MNTNALQLWFAYPADMPMHKGVPACISLLNEEERERLSAFRFDEHRQEFATTRALVRTALSSLAPVQPADWKFSTNAWGKPEVEGQQGLQFNVSNSPGLVVCLIVWGHAVGVDAEPFERANQILDLHDQVLSSAELAQLNALPAAEKMRRALALWTLKEAYIKARGMGLSIPLRQFSFLFSAENGIQLELDTELNDAANRWRFCLLEQAGHQVAIVTEKSAQLELELWENRPAHGTPRQIGSPRVVWFGDASRP